MIKIGKKIYTTRENNKINNNNNKNSLKIK